MKRGTLAVVTLVALVALLGGTLVYRSCNTPGGERSAESDRSAKVSAPPVPATSPAPSDLAAPASRARQVVPLTVYFPSRRYVESGDESLPRLVTLMGHVSTTRAIASAHLLSVKAGPQGRH